MATASLTERKGREESTEELYGVSMADQKMINCRSVLRRCENEIFEDGFG